MLIFQIYPPSLQNLELEKKMFTWDEYLYVIGCFIILIIGALVNLAAFVFFTFYQRRTTNSTYRYFIIHLSLSDFLCCLILPLFTASQVLNGGQWIFGKISCYYVMSLGKLSGLISAWILCGMTFERYNTLASPFDRLSKKTIHIFCGVVWGVAILFLFAYNKNMRYVEGYCYHAQNKTFTYVSIVKIFLQIFVPSIILVILYIRLKKLLLRRKSFRQSQSNAAVTKSCEKVILYSMILYLVCVLPPFIVFLKYDLASFHEGTFFLDINNKLIKWLYLLTYTNSVVNVFIYAGRFEDFKQFLLKIMKFGKVKKRQPDLSIISNSYQRTYDEDAQV